MNREAEFNDVDSICSSMKSKPKKRKPKIQYVWDVAPDGLSITDLTNKGWIKLHQAPQPPACDAQPNEITGYRPMTKKEIREQKKAKEMIKKRELKILYSLAKKYHMRVCNIVSDLE